MRRFLLGLVLVGILAVAGAVVFLMWDLDWRWRPHTITKHQAEIAQALDQSGWVSPHLTGPKLYVIVYRDCARLHAVRTGRVPEAAGAPTSTPG